MQKPVTTPLPPKKMRILSSACFVDEKNTLRIPCDKLHEFYKSDLSVDRIESIEEQLWQAGRPLPTRPLNIQRVLGREIIPTSDVSLHLVWYDGTIFIKALPSYLLTDEFFHEFLAAKAQTNQEASVIRRRALGFLHSYVALIQSELDFRLAADTKILPRDLTWKRWSKWARKLLTEYEDDKIYKEVSRRYVYGELRLSRLDKIYRYRYGDWLHGYSRLIGSSTYATFFQIYSGRILAVTAYILLALTAMQVGLATDNLKDNDTFQNACYGFTVFAIVLPLVLLALLFMVGLVMFVANWLRTQAFRKRRGSRIGVALSNSARRADRNTIAMHHV